MEAKEILTQVKRVARYFLQGVPQNSSLTDMLIVCHGYGQLAQYFIKHFETLDTKKYLVVAPEALSRFYWNGFSGRVGASWMTKDLRVEEIDDYVNFLTQVKQEVEQKTTGSSPLNLHILGFSQGCATVCRWIERQALSPTSLTLWAGTFPHDLNYEVFASLLQKTTVNVVYGTQDEFFTEKAFNEHLSEIERKGITFKKYIFEGKHELNKEIIVQLFD